VSPVKNREQAVIRLSQLKGFEETPRALDLVLALEVLDLLKYQPDWDRMWGNE
jgi:hypothetical protein